MNNENNTFGNQVPNNNPNIQESPVAPEPVVPVTPAEPAPAAPEPVQPVAPEPQVQINAQSTQPAQPVMQEQPQMNANNFGQYMDQEPKSNKTMFIIIAIIVVALIGLAVYFIPKIGKEKSFDETIKEIEKELEEESKELSKHYAIKEYKLLSGDILVEVENKNSVPVFGSVNFIFYDENDNMIDTADAYISGIYANKKSYSMLLIAHNVPNYARYEKTVKLSSFDFAKMYEGKVNVTATMNDDLLLAITNTASEDITECDIGVIYYDENDKIIGYETVFVDTLIPNETIAKKSYIPDDADGENIKYSRYEVVVNIAYSYDIENP